jgi:hypothetical protein
MRLPSEREANGKPREAETGSARMQQLLGVSVEILCCPHSAGPPVCWCRKPLRGPGVVSSGGIVSSRRAASMLERGRGIRASRRPGFQYRDANDFFGSGTL